MKVEQAFRLLPGVEALRPLPGMLLSSSAPDERNRWASAAPYLTVGKWNLSVEALRRRLPHLITRIAEHLGLLYQDFADALDSEERGEPVQAVAHLLAAARREEGVGRYGPALQWGEVALRVAEALNTRRPEIETLTFLGRVARAQGRCVEAARHFQRALVLAEAEFDTVGAIEASEGQGTVALVLGQLQGASAWLGRADRLAAGEEHALARGRILRALAEVARRQHDFATAGERLHHARELFERAEAGLEMALTLDAQGQLEVAAARHASGLTAFREALAWEHRAGPDPRIECTVRMHMAELHLDLGNESDAEQEMRYAERLAIAHDLGRRLVQVYTRLGALRGRQHKETGFVFFEQALALCQLLEPTPTLEAEVYHQYGIFKANLGRTDEARGWLERAREILKEAGGEGILDSIEEALHEVAG